jgi:asparagine synthase (glutamine-hydrolysing)
MLWENAAVPLVPRRLIRLAVGSERPVPEWVNPVFAKQYQLADRYDPVRVASAERTRGYAAELCRTVENLPNAIDRGVVADGLEVRYPFLHRPLVEYALRLPHHATTRPYARKWILREAMRGLLPEEVRARTTKGGIDARIAWSMSRERERLKAMLEEPILGELGVVQVEQLRDAVEAAATGIGLEDVSLTAALALETWLSWRVGRWTVHEPRSV